MFDPYLIAHLRGGEKATLRTAVIALMERGLLLFSNKLVSQAEYVTPAATKHPLERALLEKFTLPGAASSIFADQELKNLCQPYQQKLERLGLLPDAAMRRARWTRFVVALLVLLGIGLHKAALGLMRDRPVFFLFVLLLLAVVLAWRAAFPRLTARGKALLADLQTLYAGVKDGSSTLNLKQTASSTLLLAAVFGINVMAADMFGDARRSWFDGSSSSSDWGSSCSSGSSCGSSCGGGGCGGCGS